MKSVTKYGGLSPSRLLLFGDGPGLMRRQSLLVLTIMDEWCNRHSQVGAGSTVLDIWLGSFFQGEGCQIFHSEHTIVAQAGGVLMLAVQW